MTRLGCLAVAALASVGAGCGERLSAHDPTTPLPAWAKIPPQFGHGPRYRPRPGNGAVRRARPINAMRCRRLERRANGVHLEIFVRRLDVVIPAGVGIAPPRRRIGARVRTGECAYPARTRDPSGLIEVAARHRLDLGDFFDIWGQSLSRQRLLSFKGRGGVVAFLNARRWRGSPRTVPLLRHAKIMLELGGFIRPHRIYVFPPSL